VRDWATAPDALPVRGGAEQRAPATAPAARRTFGFAHALLTYLVFALGVVAVTWPLALHPGSLWPPHHDARVFTWVMTSMARRLVTDPLHLFHGNAFYPADQSLAYTELLLPPSLLGLPGFLWGNPLLTYNLLLLGLWPLNGLSMAWVAWRLTGSRGGGWLAGAVFCLSPYFTGYYLEFQMLLAALLPLTVWAWARWLETGKRLWLPLGGFVLQALTAWYYAIILGLGLATLGLGFLCLRGRGWAWRRALGQLVLGAAATVAVLLPFAWPYLEIHREFGYERSLQETAQHYADLTSFVEAGERSWFYRFAPSGHIAETQPFAGFAALALAVVALGWWRRETPLPRTPRIVTCILTVALALTAAAAIAVALLPLPRWRLGSLVIHPRPGGLLDVALLLGLALLAVRGWSASPPSAERPLGPGDWVRLLLFTAAVFAILALGPSVHVARQPRGTGPYLALYHALLPLHVIRVTVRFGVMYLLAVALLAALGWRLVENALRERPLTRRVSLAVLLGLVALEYAVLPPDYEPVQSAPRPVDQLLRAEPGDVAILEWPTNVPDTDADAMFRSLYHGKRLVNGLSGVVPAFLPELSAALTTPGPVFPAPDAQERLRRIYPLRYLVVRLTELDDTWRPVWTALRQAPPAPLRFHASLGDVDLYDLVPEPERGHRLERWFSYDLVRTRPVLRLHLRPVTARPAVEQEAAVSFNGRLVARVAINREVTQRVRLTPPYRRAYPNTVVILYGYRRPASAIDARYLIGRTGTRSPVDLRVVSAGQPHGNVAHLEVNGIEYAAPRRGYSLVAVDASGVAIRAALFDTFGDPTAQERLARWIEALPPGTVVAGAVKDEGSRLLGDAAVSALRAVGVATDLRGRYRESHAFVGVKGAAVGSALEAAGPRRLELRVGHVEWGPDTGNPMSGLELVEFTLERTDHDPR
jgi:hypothetical protein